MNKWAIDMEEPELNFLKLFELLKIIINIVSWNQIKYSSPLPISGLLESVPWRKLC